MTHPLVPAARRYIGAPFRHRGRGPRYFDCAGLLLRAFADIGHPMRDLKAYGREPANDGLRQIVVANLGPPVKDGLQVGDVLLMKFVARPHHLGLVGDYAHGDLSLIHAYAEAGYVTEHRLDDVWRSRILEVFRWPA